MLKWFNKNKEKKNKGFTLVELIVVIAILAILVGLLAPQYTKYVEKSRKSADVSNLENIVTGFKVAASDHEYNLGSSTNDKTTYTIVIGKGETTITPDKNEGNDFVTAINEYAGLDFSTNNKTDKLKLKSQKWGAESLGNTTAPSISAKVTIDNKTDSVTVKYSSNVESYSKDGKLTSATPDPPNSEENGDQENVAQ